MYQIPVSLPIKSLPLPHGLETKEGCMKIFFLSAKNKGAPGTLSWIEKTRCISLGFLIETPNMGFKDSTLKKQNWCNFGMFLEIILYILCFIQYFHSFLACFFLSFQPAISSSHPPKNGEVSETSASSNPLDSPRTRAKVRFSLIVHRSGGWGNKIGQQKKKHFGKNW